MNQWTFFGRIVPERIPLRLDFPMKGTSTAPKTGVTYDYDIAIADGQVVANMTITKGQADVHTLRNLIEGDIRDVADVIGYLHGLSFDVDIISAASQESGQRIVFGIAIPVLVARRKREDLGKIKGELLLAVFGSDSAKIALADFREAMRNPLGTGFFCYRAAEAMMQAMKSHDAEKEKDAWPRLRVALQVDQSALMFLKSHADMPRHGKPNSITDAERARVFEITDEIIRRYLELLVRKCAALPAAEFPILTA